MLCLSRKVDEEVVIGSDITVRVLEIRGKLVRLGFNGPPEVPIHRREVFDAIEAKKENSSDTPG